MGTVSLLSPATPDLGAHRSPLGKPRLPLLLAVALFTLARGLGLPREGSHYF